MTINTGSVGGDEKYYEFVFRGSIGGKHYTLNELNTNLDYECTLPPNSGQSVDINNLDFQDFLSNKESARFYTKDENEPPYIENYIGSDVISISWKNFRENISFSYPAVKAGTQPSFMTIYSTGGKAGRWHV